MKLLSKKSVIQIEFSGDEIEILRRILFSYTGEYQKFANELHEELITPFIGHCKVCGVEPCHFYGFGHYFCSKKILNSKQNIKTIPDISFVDGKILHNNCVNNFVEQEKMKNPTFPENEEEISKYQEKDIIRDIILKERGWTIIRIVDTEDVIKKLKEGGLKF